MKKILFIDFLFIQIFQNGDNSSKKRFFHYVLLKKNSKKYKFYLACEEYVVKISRGSVQ